MPRWRPALGSVCEATVKHCTVLGLREADWRFQPAAPMAGLSRESEGEEDHRPVLHGGTRAALFLAVQEGARRGQDLPGVHIAVKTDQQETNVWKEVCRGEI